MGKLTCYKAHHDIIYGLHLFGGKKWLNLSNVRQRLHGCFFICNCITFPAIHFHVSRREEVFVNQCLSFTNVSSFKLSLDESFTVTLSIYKHFFKAMHTEKFRTMSGVTYGATFNAVIGSRLFRKQVTLVPLPASKL